MSFVDEIERNRDRAAVLAKTADWREGRLTNDLLEEIQTIGPGQPSRSNKKTSVKSGVESPERPESPERHKSPKGPSKFSYGTGGPTDEEYQEILKGMGVAGVGSLLSSAAMYSGVPVTRYLLTGDPFPRYKKPSGEVGETSIWKDLLRQTIGSVIGLPTRLLFTVLPFLVAKHLSPLSRVDTNPVMLALVDALSHSANTALIDPLTRYFEYGSFYPTYLAGDNKEVQHSILHDLLYGLAYSAPEALANAVAIPYLKSIEESIEQRNRARILKDIEEFSRKLDQLKKDPGLEI